MQQHLYNMYSIIYSREHRARRMCAHIHLAVLCADGTHLVPTEVKRRPAAGYLTIKQRKEVFYEDFKTYYAFREPYY